MAWSTLNKIAYANAFKVKCCSAIVLSFSETLSVEMISQRSPPKVKENCKLLKYVGNQAKM